VGIVLIVCGVLALISLDALLLRLSYRGRLIVERRKLGLPLYGRSMRNVNLSIFCDTIGRHLEYGSSLSEALAAAQKAVPSAVFREEVSKLGRELQAGSTLSEAMKRSKWFPFALIRAVAAGESRGQLASTLIEMADSYYEESDYVVQRMVRWARAWVASLGAACLLFCLLTFLILIVTVVASLWTGVVSSG
jgi:type IV pilus assembly protein PilC